MKNKLFSGIMPALITPVDEDGNLLKNAAEQVMQYEMRSGITGFYVNGGTGEGPVLPEKTRMEMAETAVECAGGKVKLINHIGSPDIQTALRLAKHAGQAGFDAVSSVLPNFYFDYPVPRILDYFKRIADISGLPVIVYANGLTHCDPVDFMTQVIRVEGVTGVKFTMYDYYAMHRICELNGGDINVLNGPDEMLICGLVMGCDGGIGTTYNIMSEWFCSLYNAYRSGRLEEACSYQFRINRVIDIIRAKGPSIPLVKEVFRMRGIDCGYAVYPTRRYTTEEAEELRILLSEAGIEF